MPFGKKVWIRQTFRPKITNSGLSVAHVGPRSAPTKSGRNPAMKAWKIAAGISCCLILATGCSMCQHPYYDCGPVWSQGVCQNCNPDYRAGSILNRHGPGVLAAEDAPERRRTRRASRRSGASCRNRRRRSRTQPVRRIVSSQVRATTVAQQRRTPKRAPAEAKRLRRRQRARSCPRRPCRAICRRAPLPHPPGTKEGDTRILSVTDRRLDELQRIPKPVAAQRKAPQPADGEAQRGSRRLAARAPRQDPRKPQANCEIDR